MALIDPPAFLGLAGNEYPAARLRRVHELMLGGREGCLAADHMAVTQTGTPGLSVQVSAGAAIVNGDDSTRQGSYLVENDAAVTVGPVSTPHATLLRIDRLVLEVLDEEGTASGGGGRGSDLPQYRIVAGTPSSSPAAPAEPATAITLALITVAAGASAIVNASIADRRPACNPQAGPVGTTGFTALAAPPWGALLLNGGVFDAGRYPLLATALGGNTLPGDARGRALIGAGEGSGLTNRTLGQAIGAEPLSAHAHSGPSHRHGRGSLTVGNDTGPYSGLYIPVASQAWEAKGVAAGTGAAAGVWLDAGIQSRPATWTHGHTLSGDTDWGGTGSTSTTGSGNHGVMQPSLVQTAYIWAA